MKKTLIYILLFFLPLFSYSQKIISHIGFYGETKNPTGYLMNYVTSKVGDVASLENLEKDRLNLVSLPEYGHVHLKIDSLAE